MPCLEYASCMGMVKMLCTFQMYLSKFYKALQGHFILLLLAFNLGGLVDEVLSYVGFIPIEITTTMKHYAQKIYLLGQAGFCHKAKNLIKTMACENMCVHAWPYLVLEKFMEIWRWENAL